MKYCRKTIDAWQVLCYSNLAKGWVLDYLYYTQEKAHARCHDLVTFGYNAKVVKRRRKEV